MVDEAERRYDLVPGPQPRPHSANGYCSDDHLNPPSPIAQRLLDEQAEVSIPGGRTQLAALEPANDAMYHGCSNPGSTGLCRSVRAVSVRADITPARSLRSDIFRYRSTLADTSVFRIWEQEAESSNLSIPTHFRHIEALRLGPQSGRCITDLSDFDAVCTAGVRGRVAGNGASDGPQATRQAGRLCRRRRGQARTETVRHLRVRTISTCCCPETKANDAVADKGGVSPSCRCLTAMLLNGNRLFVRGDDEFFSTDRRPGVPACHRDLYCD